MKNRTVKILKGLLRSKALLCVAALGMLVSCDAYMGGYSETDGAYYNPNSDQIPQDNGNYADGNQVGGYYDFDDDGGDYNDNSNSLIRQNQYNNEQQANKYQNWGGQDDSDFGTYAGTDTYYTDFGSPFWGFGGWGSPYWGYGGWGSPWGYGYGFNNFWGYPYGGFGFGMSFGWGGSWYGGYPFYGGYYPYYGGYYPYYGGRGHYGYRGDVRYRPRTKSMLANNGSTTGFQSRRNISMITNGVRNSNVSRPTTGFRRVTNNGEVITNGGRLNNQGFRQMRYQNGNIRLDGRINGQSNTGRFTRQNAQNRRQGNWSQNEYRQMRNQQSQERFESRTQERSNNNFNNERSFSTPSRSFEGGGFRSESFGGGRSGGMSNGGGFRRTGGR